jgi:hypothetical protein
MLASPTLLIDLADDDNLVAAVQVARDWIAANLVSSVLNVAGPRGSEHPDVYPRSVTFLRALLGGGEA